jgi:hypothetical protein
LSLRLSLVISLRCHWSLGFSTKKQDGKKSPDGGLEKAVPFPMTNDKRSYSFSINLSTPSAGFQSLAGS